MARTYQMPNGHTTTDVDTMLGAWKAPAETIIAHFPDLQLAGFNPGYLFTYRGRGGSLDLPKDFVLQLASKLGQLDESSQQDGTE